MSGVSQLSFFRDGRSVYALEECRDRFGRLQKQNRIYCGIQGAPGVPEAELEAVARLFEWSPNLLKAAIKAFCVLDKLTLTPAEKDALDALNIAVTNALGKTGWSFDEEPRA